MGSSSVSPNLPSPEFLAVFRANADSRGRMSFAKFMELALYHPNVGYYTKDRQRIGYAPGSDFFTASTSGPLFGELIAAACSQVLRNAGRQSRDHVFVELGAEPGTGGIMNGVAHSFARVKTLHLGEPVLLAGECVVFSNELFDAQPFVRSVFRNGRWLEMGVELRDNNLYEVALASSPPCTPDVETEGYRFDQPHAAVHLAESITAQSWTGLFVAIDYGKTFRELSQEAPGGTARAYHRHTQSNDLLANPGDQDLTCHVCWDWIIDALRRNGFVEPTLEFQ